MIKREEVEALLTECEGSYYPAVTNAELSELARTWLAVDAAQSAEITREDWLENFTQIGPDMIGQRVRLVPEADSGGGRG